MDDSFQVTGLSAEMAGAQHISLRRYDLSRNSRRERTYNEENSHKLFQFIHRSHLVGRSQGMFNFIL